MTNVLRTLINMSNMFNQCFIFATIFSFELVEALVPNYACTTTNKNICLFVYIYMYVYVSVYYTYAYIIVQFCAHLSMKCYRSPMTISI